VLQAQLRTLQLHKGLNDTISQQRKDLWTTEAKFQVLEEAARTRSLTKQEKSLLSGKAQVLQLARQKALLGDQIVAQEQLNKRMDTAQKYVTQMAEKQQALVGEPPSVTVWPRGNWQKPSSLPAGKMAAALLMMPDTGSNFRLRIIITKRRISFVVTG
jgi:hypothetical protein